jgi:Na+/glutamate symporter
MSGEIIDALMNSGAGLGGGGVLGAILAKYLVNKAEREVRYIKKELSENKELDSARDTAIQLLKLDMENRKSLFEKLERQMENLYNKVNK